MNADTPHPMRQHVVKLSVELLRLKLRVPHPELSRRMDVLRITEFLPVESTKSCPGGDRAKHSSRYPRTRFCHSPLLKCHTRDELLRERINPYVIVMDNLVWTK